MQPTLDLYHTIAVASPALATIAAALLASFLYKTFG